MINAKFVRVLLLCVLFAFAGCVHKRLKPLSPIPLPASMSAQQTADAIKHALDHRGWAVVSEQPNRIRASLSKDGAAITADILYDRSGVVIDYVDSQGLDYEKDGSREYIDKGYYRWVKYLRKSIRAELHQEADAKDDTEE